MRRLVLVLAVAACQPTAGLDGLGFPGRGGGGLGALGPALSRAAVGTYRTAIDHPAPPIALAPGDGSDLAIAALDAKVTVTGPLAATEIHFTFHNDEARVREGRFSITLPSGATVDRFAMRVGDVWREAKAVSRERGRQVYETYLHRGVDPALLESDAGNAFSARVFPIPAHADKEIIIGYTQRVAVGQPYTLALHGLPVIGKLAIDIDNDGAHSRIDRTFMAPDDVVVDARPGSVALAAGEAFVARLDLDVEHAPAPLDRVAILVDTSASRAPIMGRQAALVAHVIGALPSHTEVVVAAFDQGVTEVYRGRAADFDPQRATDRLLEHGALGASDLGAALGRAAQWGLSRLVIVGDGVATLGEHEPRKLAALARGFDRVDAVQIGQSLDRDALAAIVRAGHLAGAIIDGNVPTRVLRPLSTAVAAEQVIEVEGAAKSWPLTTRGTAPGEPVFVFGLRDRALAAAPLAVRIGARRVLVEPHVADETTIRRSVARAEVADLTERMQRAAEPAVARQIEAVALQFGIASTETSLIVLESDGDEQRMLTPVERGVTAVADVEPDDARLLADSVRNGEVIRVSGSAPVRDPQVTRSGITIDTRGDLEMVPRTVTGSVQSSLKVDLPSGNHGQLAETIVINGGWPAAEPEPAPVPRDEPTGPSPYKGQLADIMTALAHGDRAGALATAVHWELGAPGDLAALIGLGEALEARGATELAARAYGSLIDLYPSRAELARAAGERFDRLGTRALAIDAYQRALRERPDQVSTYRLLGYALVRAHRTREALDVLVAGIAHAPRDSIKRILTEDAALVGAAILADDPDQRNVVRAKVPIELPTQPSLRVVLGWETDANDVDLHVMDRAGGHAWYSHKDLASGGQLLDDVTDGFGPEMFVATRPAAFPYRLSAVYFRKGPMGVGFGSVQVIRHDGAGHLSISDRPFTIQTDGAKVDLGTVED